jgi:hypothetical protein
MPKKTQISNQNLSGHMKIKSITTTFIALAALTALNCMAEECGKRLTDAQIERFIESINVPVNNLSQHTQALLLEEGNLIAAGAFERADRVAREQVLISSADQVASYVSNNLDKTLLLAQLKNVMVDQRDRMIVEKILSLIAKSVKDTSQRAHERISQLLSKVTRPGIAVDVAKLRDSLAEINKVFSSCTAPPIRGKQ